MPSTTAMPRYRSRSPTSPVPQPGSSTGSEPEKPPQSTSPWRCWPRLAPRPLPTAVRFTATRRGRSHRPIDNASATYAGIISTGTFTHGHVGSDGIIELQRIAQPGARRVMGVNASIFETNGFKDRFKRCATEGVIDDLEVQYRQVYEGADGSDPNHMAQIAVFTVA